jgi:hypothetical protein
MMTFVHSLLERFRLPPYRRINLGYEPTYYGAAANIARQLELSNATPQHCYVWSHGCRLIEAEDVRYYIRFPELSGNVLVAREAEAKHLSSHGVDKVHAVGLPICYTARGTVSRRAGSLLVMPHHATFDSKSSETVLEYADYITSIRHQFNRIVCCLSRQCLREKSLRKLFQQRGMPVVCGSAIDDANSLARTRRLLEQFDYVTTNTFGSHLAYAMAFGAKVSIAGPVYRPSTEDLANEPFYIENPDLNDPDYRRSRHRTMEKTFAKLKVDPWNAREHVEWGRHLVGAENVKSPREIGKLLGLQGA